jgi:hypothetical protein
MRARILGLTSLVVSATAAFIACQDNGDGTIPPIPGHYYNPDSGPGVAPTGDDSGVVVTPTGDGGPCVETTSASPDGGVTVGPATLAFDPCGAGSPDALYWDATKQVLYIADDHDGTIWTWTDAAGFQKIAHLPANDAGAMTVGGITGFGNLIVLSLNGGGTAGALFQYDVSTASGVATTIGGTVDPARRRTGVAYDTTGTRFFSASFASTGGGGDGGGGGGGGDAGAASGSIDLIQVTSTTAFVTGLVEPHGLLVSGSQFIVGDHGRGEVIAFPIVAADLLDAGPIDAGLDAADDGGDAGDAATTPLYTTLAALPGVDQLSIGPTGVIYAGQHSSDGGAPQIHRITTDGGSAPFQPTVAFTQLGGIAYDTQYNRVFVADSNGTSVRTIKIYPAQ